MTRQKVNSLAIERRFILKDMRWTLIGVPWFWRLLGRFPSLQLGNDLHPNSEDITKKDGAWFQSFHLGENLGGRETRHRKALQGTKIRDSPALLWERKIALMSSIWSFGSACGFEVDGWGADGRDSKAVGKVGANLTQCHLHAFGERRMGRCQSYTVPPTCFRRAKNGSVLQLWIVCSRTVVSYSWWWWW